MEIQPYTVVRDEEDLCALIARCNELCLPFSFPQKTAGALPAYDALLESLVKMEHIDLAPLGELLAPLPDGKSRVAIRHDVDHDIVAAVAMSRIEKARTVSACYYLHHLSPYYYGRFDEACTFHRYEAAGELYRELQANGAEVGLHVDALSCYLMGVDGAQAVRTELAWLREIGLTVRGATAHGSAPHYGAENFQIFREHALGANCATGPDGQTFPLGVLSAQELHLEYEGNFASAKQGADHRRLSAYLAGEGKDDRDAHLRTYLHDNPHARWAVDFTIWTRGRDLWVLAASDPDGAYQDDASSRDVLAFLSDVPAGTRIVLHVHPCYFGLRVGPASGPVELPAAACGQNQLIAMTYYLSDVMHQMADLARRRHESVETQLARLDELSAKVDVMYRKYDAVRKVVHRMVPPRRKK